MTNRLPLSTSLIGFYGLFRKEVVRWLRIWSQTLLPSAITTTLYFLIFGHVIGQRMGMIAHVSYITYIAPGLIMMAVITSSYANSSSSFFFTRLNRTIEELLVSPLPITGIILGYCFSSMARGICVGCITYAVAAYFTGLHLVHPLLTLFALCLCSALFALAGLLNGILARKMEDMNIFITFILTPLIYLGGIFYSVQWLTGIWYWLSKINPIYYIITLFRSTMIGVHVESISLLMVLLCSFVVLLFAIDYYLLATGYRIKS